MLRRARAVAVGVATLILLTLLSLSRSLWARHFKLTNSRFCRKLAKLSRQFTADASHRRGSYRLLSKESPAEAGKTHDEQMLIVSRMGMSLTEQYL